MYIEQQHGEMGFAEQQIRGVGQAPGLGAITAASLAAAATPDMSAGAPAAPAGPPQQMVAMPAPVEDSKMPMIVGGLMLLGLGFVIYKATRE